MPSLPLLLGVLSACALVGGVPALVNVLKPRLQQLLAIDQQRVDRLERMQYFLAWVAGMPLAGWLVDRWNPLEVLIAGSIGVATTLAFFGVAQSPRWIGAMSFLLGLASSFLTVAALHLAPQALGPENCPAAALNLAFVAIGVGSFTPQWIFPRLERWAGLRRALLALGLGALLPTAFLLAGFASHMQRPIAPPQPDASVAFYYDPHFWLLAIMLLLYYPIESALDIWSEPFLREIGYEDRKARAMLVVFWLAFLGARVGMWFLLGPRNEIWILWFCVLTSGIVLGNLVGAYGASAGGLGFWLVGACYGPLLPGFLGMVIEYCPAAPGLALGCVLAAAGMHDALAQPLMQRGAQARSVRVAMRIPLLMTLLMLAPLLIVRLMKS